MEELRALEMPREALRLRADVQRERALMVTWNALVAQIRDISREIARGQGKVGGIVLQRLERSEFLGDEVLGK